MLPSFICLPIRCSSCIPTPEACPPCRAVYLDTAGHNARALLRVVTRQETRKKLNRRITTLNNQLVNFLINLFNSPSFLLALSSQSFQRSGYEKLLINRLNDWVQQIPTTDVSSSLTVVLGHSYLGVVFRSLWGSIFFFQSKTMHNKTKTRCIDLRSNLQLVYILNLSSMSV